MPTRARTLRRNAAALALNTAVRASFWGLGLVHRVVDRRLRQQRAARRRQDPFWTAAPVDADPLAS